MSGQSKLKDMKEIGIKKVELVCSQDCECCKEYKNKQIPIEVAPELPMQNCPLWRCFGRWCAIVEFDLTQK